MGMRRERGWVRAHGAVMWTSQVAWVLPFICPFLCGMGSQGKTWGRRKTRSELKKNTTLWFPHQNKTTGTEREEARQAVKYSRGRMMEGEVRCLWWKLCKVQTGLWVCFEYIANRSCCWVAYLRREWEEAKMGELWLEQPEEQIC